ncbi:MAG: hypothetical protein E7513_02455 [Ruminococcaceae bacterium]|nr:hypothetical protein [Oscillospiraceae bacterium]
MKKLYASISILLFLILNLSGCSTIGEKNASLSLVYGAAAILSLLLLSACFFLVHKKKVWFVLLFSSVLVVNIGYTFLSVSSNLEMALFFNRIAYLGSVFLPLAMLMIILNTTNTQYKKRLPIVLFSIAILVFLVAASPGILDIYYKEVSFEIVNGVSTLVKVYGALHPLYLFYLLGYFATMVAVIIRASVKKTIDTTAHAVILVIAVFVNIGVWLIEQLVSIDFEMLSVSYIISELFLLGLHLVMNENQRLREIVKQVETVQSFCETETIGADTMLENPLETEKFDTARFEIFINGTNRLTTTEKAIYDSYIARLTTKEIMNNLNIKENTLKFHNKNIYSKLGVSSRKELLEIYIQLKAAKEKLSDKQ